MSDSKLEVYKISEFSEGFAILDTETGHFKWKCKSRGWGYTRSPADLEGYQIEMPLEEFFCRSKRTLLESPEREAILLEYL